MTRDEKLTHLATIIGNVPDSYFNMGLWKCNTNACAAGHAAQDPVFQSLGLSLSGEFPLEGIKYRNADSFIALAQFFEHSHLQAINLFTADPNCYKGASAKNVFLTRLNNLRKELSSANV